MYVVKHTTGDWYDGVGIVAYVEDCEAACTLAMDLQSQEIDLFGYRPRSESYFVCEIIPTTVTGVMSAYGRINEVEVFQTCTHDRYVRVGRQRQLHSRVVRPVDHPSLWEVVGDAIERQYNKINYRIKTSWYH